MWASVSVELLSLNRDGMSFGGGEKNRRIIFKNFA